MPILQGAQGVTISGGTLNGVNGDMTINNSGSHTTNYGSYNTTNETYNNSNNDYSRNDFSKHSTKNVHQGTVNNIGNAKNVNTGANYGTISQEDNRGAIPPMSREGYPQRGYDYQQAYRPPNPHSYSAPAPGPYWQEEPQYYGHPPYQPPSAYHSRGYPPGDPQYQDRAYYATPPESHRFPPEMPPMVPRNAEIPREGTEEQRMSDRYYGRPYDGAEFNSHRPVPPAGRGLTSASDRQARSDMTASAPPTISSSNASSRRAAPPAMKSKNPFKNIFSKDKDAS